MSAIRYPAEPRTSESGAFSTTDFIPIHRWLILLSAVLALTAAESKPKPPITALAFSPDGKYLVSASPKSILIWDTTPTPNPQPRFSGPRPLAPVAGRVRAIAFSPDGQTIAVAQGIPGRAGSVSIFDFDSGSATLLETTPDEMLAVAFSPDGKFLAAAGTNNTVEVWTLPGHPLAATLKSHTAWVTGLAFTPDSKALASSSLDRSVRVWDTAKWTERLQLPQTLTEPVNAVAVAPEGDIVAFAEAGDTEHAIRIWRTQNTTQQTRPFDTGTCTPLAVAFQTAPQHSRMVVGCTDNTLRVMNTNGGTVQTLTGHTDWVYAVAVTRDGQKVASGSGDGTIKLWNFAGKLIATLNQDAAK